MLGITRKLGRGIKSVYKRRWFRRLTVTGAIVAVLVVLGSYVLRYVDGPTTGTITATVPTTAPKPTTKVSLQGTYADFIYPSDFIVSPDGDPHPPQLEIYSFVSHKSISVLLGVQVLSLPSGNLSDDGSYNYRRVNPTKYKLETKTINGQQVFVMTDTTAGYNKTAFFVHAGKEGTVNINSADTTQAAALDQELTDIVASWQWHA
jgi:hypothetical protein